MDRRINWPAALFLLLTPLVALVWGGWHLHVSGPSMGEIVFALAYFAAVAMSVTAGYHRHFAHRAYDCNRVVQLWYLLVGAAAFQNSVLVWASDHRRHHKHLDQDGDPYNIRRGFLWAHIGWMLMRDHMQARFANVPDLQANPLVRWQQRFYFPLAIAMSFGVPLAVGAAVGDPLGYLLWGGFVRVVVGHHTTFLVNSLAHTLGKQPYTRAISARDSWITAVLTFGEGYHNFHHRFAADYRNGVRRHQWDPTKWLIRGLAAIGCAWNLRRAPRERIVAAQVHCEMQRLLDRMRDRSEQVRRRAREALAEMARSVEHAAARVGTLERTLAARRAEHRANVARVRAELRSASDEFRRTRQRWRQMLEELAIGSFGLTA